MSSRNTPKVVGIGLNKTATKSLALCFQTLGYRNQSYSLEAFRLYQDKNWQALFNIMDEHDSFEDWPWPLMYREIDQRYPDARFLLTVRKSPEAWYRSLCKMAVRMGPLSDFEKPIYGYAMPQAAKAEHLAFYENHNAQVRAYFADRPGKLLEICFDHDVDMTAFCQFLDEPTIELPKPHVNRSANVYAGDNIWLAHLNRIVFQTHWYSVKALKHVKGRLKALLRRPA
ncbi:MAG: sulfotransferase [Granulosicoccus sp.]